MVYYKITDELAHHGTRGMKWGIRRFQNKDGSLTPAGKKRRGLMETVHDYRVKYKRKKALAKARQTKAENKKKAEEERLAAEQRMKDVMAGKVSAKKMTDTELNYRLARINAEKQYKDAQLATSTGKRFVHKMWNDMMVPGMVEGGKRLVSDTIFKKGTELLGLDKKEAKSALQQLREDAEVAKLKKQMTVDNDWLKNRAEKKAAEKEAKKAEKEAKKSKDDDIERVEGEIVDDGYRPTSGGNYSSNSRSNQSSSSSSGFNYPAVVNSNTPLLTAKSNTSIKRDWYDQWLDDYF